MKSILFISHSSNIGGGEEDFLKLLKYFNRKYNIVSIYPFGKNSNAFREYSNQYYEINGFVFPFSKFSFKGYIKFFIINIKYFCSIYNFIKKNKPINLCYLNSSVCFFYVIFLKLFKIPYVLSIKEKINPYFVSKIIYLLYKKTAKKIYTISEFLKEDFINKTGRKDLKIIYSTLDTNYFQNIIKEISFSKKEKENFNIINIGHIYPLKGQHLLVEALSRLSGKNICVEFIGRIIDDKYFSKIKKIISNYSLSNICKFSGELEKKDVIHKLFKSDCVIITSKEEGQSFALLEALYTEKPVITSKVGVASEIIVNEKNGIFYDFNNIDSLCTAIMKLMNDKEMYMQIKGNCRRTYNTYFNSDISMSKWEKEFSSFFKY